jgi:hypothetical protein
VTGLRSCYANLGLLAFRLWASTDCAITASFSKEVAKEDILLLFLGELMDLGKQLSVYYKRDEAPST